MPCKPLDLLSLAKTLGASQGGEAAERCAASRAYYAALHEVDATFFDRPEFKRDGESSHREIISRAVVYGKSIKPGRTDAAQIAQLMNRMRRSRNKADYAIEELFTTTESTEILSRAELVINLCQSVSSKLTVAVKKLA